MKCLQAKAVESNAKGHQQCKCVVPQIQHPPVVGMLHLHDPGRQITRHPRLQN